MLKVLISIGKPEDEEHDTQGKVGTASRTSPPSYSLPYLKLHVQERKGKELHIPEEACGDFAGSEAVPVPWNRGCKDLYESCQERLFVTFVLSSGIKSYQRSSHTFENAYPS